MCGPRQNPTPLTSSRTSPPSLAVHPLEPIRQRNMFDTPESAQDLTPPSWSIPSNCSGGKEIAGCPARCHLWFKGS